MSSASYAGADLRRVLRQGSYGGYGAAGTVNEAAQASTAYESAATHASAVPVATPAKSYEAPAESVTQATNSAASPDNTRCSCGIGSAGPSGSPGF